jgi:hypothetical protein
LSTLPFITNDMISSLTSSAYSISKLGLTDEEREIVLGVYMQGLHYIYIFFAACTGTNMLLNVGVGNTPLKPPKKPPTQVQEASSDDTPGHVSEENKAPSLDGNVAARQSVGEKKDQDQEQTA